MGSVIINYLKLLRIKQWIKNIFVFVPLFFSGNLFSPFLFFKSLIAFFSFCLISSSIYSLNDVIDRKDDVRHPVKRQRPVAAGKIKPASACLVSFFLCILSLLISIFLLPLKCSFVILIYFVMNIFYVFKLKQVAILDMFIIATGFILRLWIDGLACDITLSPWIVSMTFILMLFLAVAKRSDDLSLIDEGVEVGRKSIVNYNRDLLNQLMTLLSGIAIVCYLMYTMSAEVIKRIGNDYLYLTTVFVVFGIFRYLQIAIVKKQSGDPTVVMLTDNYIIAAVLGWLASFSYILYFS